MLWTLGANYYRPNIVPTIDFRELGTTFCAMTLSIEIPDSSTNRSSFFQKGFNNGSLQQRIFPANQFLPQNSVQDVRICASRGSVCRRSLLALQSIVPIDVHTQRRSGRLLRDFRSYVVPPPCPLLDVSIKSFHFISIHDKHEARRRHRPCLRGLRLGFRPHPNRQRK